MGAFLKIILYAVLIFYAFNMIIKWIFRRKMKKLEQKIEQSSDQNEDKASSHKTPRVNPDIGEYTDFEEVE